MLLRRLYQQCYNHQSSSCCRGRISVTLDTNRGYLSSRLDGVCMESPIAGTKTKKTDNSIDFQHSLFCRFQILYFSMECSLFVCASCWRGRINASDEARKPTTSSQQQPYFRLDCFPATKHSSFWSLLLVLLFTCTGTCCVERY